MGNIYLNELAEMWNSESKKKFCLEQLMGSRFSHPKCSRCCAPDDVAHKEDILDDDADNLIKKIIEEQDNG